MLTPKTVTRMLGLNKPKLIQDIAYTYGGVVTGSRISSNEAIRQLAKLYGFDKAKAERALEVARRVGPDAEPVANGYITITYQGRSLNVPHYAKYVIETHTGKSAGKVAHLPPMKYNRESDVKPIISQRKAKAMPPKRTRAAAVVVEEPEEVEEEEGGQFDHHLTKNLSPTMQDYAVWFEENVAALDDVDPARLLALGSSLYPHFQKSDLNQERREARKAARASAVEEDDDEEVEETPPAKPAKRTGRTAAAPAAKSSAAPAKAPARRTRQKTAAPY
jgi:hypothetical protein